MTNTSENKDKKFVFYVGFNETNDNEEIKTVIDNIKRFKDETKSGIKYNFVKNAYIKKNENKEVVKFNSHVYFKLKLSEIETFKNYQNDFSKSKFFTHSTYEPTEDEKEMLLSSKNSFLNIYYDEEKNIFNIKSNTTKNAHFYFFKRIFLDNKQTMDYSKFKYFRK